MENEVSPITVQTGIEGMHKGHGSLSEEQGLAVHIITISDEQTLALYNELLDQSENVVALNRSDTLSSLTRSLREMAPAKGWDSMHIYSHGDTGRFWLGGSEISNDSLTGLREDLRELGSMVRKEGDILIYGCEVGKGTAGEHLVEQIANTTSADIAASDNKTGASRAGADWELEIRQGEIEAEKWRMSNAPEWNGTLSIQPSTWITSASYIDGSGDLVSINVTGGGSFQITLAGGRVDGADATSVVLKETTAASGLSVTVTPQKLSINAGSIDEGDGGQYNRLYSPGYTTIDSVVAADGSTEIGSIYLSSTIVNRLELQNQAVGNITIDAGYTPFSDRVNTSSLDGGDNSPSPSISVSDIQAAAELELFDESPTGNSTNDYNPVTGLVDVGSINARSIRTMSINGAISAPTTDPYDPLPLTNNIRGEIRVAEAIGTIEAPRSGLTGEIRAGSIEKINIGLVQGEITTNDPSAPMTIGLDSQFRGFIRSAGHLNLGFNFNLPPKTDGDLEPKDIFFGEVHAGGGLSGTQTALDDPLMLPNNIYNLYKHDGSALAALGEEAIGTLISNGIANVNINGIGNARLISAGDIGNISANSFTDSMLVEAEGNIGDIEAYLFSEIPNPQPEFPPEPPVPGELSGTYRAVRGRIGNVKAATNLVATLQAGKEIGDITAFEGGIHSLLIDAGTSIGDIWAKKQELFGGKIVAQAGDIGDIYIATGAWDNSLRAPQGSIGDIWIEKGRLEIPSITAGVNLGNMTVKGANAITGGTITAGQSIGNIRVTARTGYGISGTLIQAGDESGLYKAAGTSVHTPAKIGNVDVIAYGAVQLPAFEPLPDPSASLSTNAIENTVLVSGAIGNIKARAFTGSGIVSSEIHAQQGNPVAGFSIQSIKAIGGGNALDSVNVVSEDSIGNVTGLSQVQGHGVTNCQFLANTGSIGMIAARGGVGGGSGITGGTYVQSRKQVSGVKARSNANGGHAIEGLTLNAGSIGFLEAKVLGGEGGEPTEPFSSGIVDSTITTFGFNNDPTDPNKVSADIGDITVGVGSIYGEGIKNTILDSSGSIKKIIVECYNSNGINGSTVTASGNIGLIQSESTNAGTAILDSQFRSKKGSIVDGDQPTKLSVKAVSGGGSAEDHGIFGSSFTAYMNLGLVQSDTAGGYGIGESSFRADSGYTNMGNIGGFEVGSSGINLAASTAMKGVVASGSRIGNIQAKISEFRGGAAMSEVLLTARNAMEESAGEIRGRERMAFNNRGEIGNITVRSASRVGNGVEFSQFLAGAGGKIGNIDIDMLWQPKQPDWSEKENRQASGVALYGSSIRATGIDPDANVFSGKIGNITIKAGRVIPDSTVPPVPPIPPLPPIPQVLYPPPNDQSTEAPSGINLSYIAAYGGIGAITVNSVGTGIGNSAIYARSDILNPLITRNLSVAKVKPRGKVKSLNVAGIGLFAEDVINSQIIPTPIP
ncbi:DUF4347 domain-containing protein [Vulcanococcus sp. Clear-D1]|uniref:DUF4347 domain-containing protein n=1 Tax=Vulcanococcus sp. Clear-D1 TaxID=2766970 RepID=UPI0019BCB2CC|nr:DUF4347 domain-containing protein [Vulcanococcus sp. Clear-D1]MBD1195484.1 DUF4347 domain-containing protein [Vulcanococcus sp. Clear-D1]